MKNWDINEAQPHRILLLLFFLIQPYNIVLNIDENFRIQFPLELYIIPLGKYYIYACINDATVVRKPFIVKRMGEKLVLVLCNMIFTLVVEKTALFFIIKQDIRFI